MSMCPVVERYVRSVRRQNLPKALFGVGTALLLIGLWGAFGISGFTMLLCWMLAFGVFAFRSISIYEQVNGGNNVPDEVLRMIAEESTLPRRFKEGLAQALALQSTITFAELAQLDTKLQKEEEKVVAREGAGFRKLAAFNEAA